LTADRIPVFAFFVRKATIAALQGEFSGRSDDFSRLRASEHMAIDHADDLTFPSLAFIRTTKAVAWTQVLNHGV
jgi:hypothetical protein